MTIYDSRLIGQNDLLLSPPDFFAFDLQGGEEEGGEKAKWFLLSFLSVTGFILKVHFPWIWNFCTEGAFISMQFNSPSPGVMLLLEVMNNYKWITCQLSSLYFTLVWIFMSTYYDFEFAKNWNRIFSIHLSKKNMEREREREEARAKCIRVVLICIIRIPAQLWVLSSFSHLQLLNTTTRMYFLPLLLSNCFFGSGKLFNFGPFAGPVKNELLKQWNLPSTQRKCIIVQFALERHFTLYLPLLIRRKSLASPSPAAHPIFRPLWPFRADLCPSHSP